MRHIMSFAVVCAAVFAVAGGASASAVAAPQHFINGVSFHGEETVEMKVKAGTHVDFTSKLGDGETITILCAKARLNAGKSREDFKASAKAISFEECKVDTPTGCMVASTLTTTEVTSEAVDTGTNGVSLKFKPKAGATLITINVAGELCRGEGAYPVKGTGECEELTPTVEAVSKGCNFTTTSGSSLMFSMSPAELIAETELALAGTKKGKVWTVRH